MAINLIDPGPFRESKGQRRILEVPECDGVNAAVWNVDSVLTAPCAVRVDHQCQNLLSEHDDPSPRIVEVIDEAWFRVVEIPDST